MCIRDRCCTHCKSLYQHNTTVQLSIIICSRQHTGSISMMIIRKKFTRQFLPCVRVCVSLCHFLHHKQLYHPTYKEKVIIDAVKLPLCLCCLLICICTVPMLIFSSSRFNLHLVPFSLATEDINGS